MPLHLFRIVFKWIIQVICSNRWFSFSDSLYKCAAVTHPFWYCWTFRFPTFLLWTLLDMCFIPLLWGIELMGFKAQVCFNFRRYCPAVFESSCSILYFQIYLYDTSVYSIFSSKFRIVWFCLFGHYLEHIMS